MDANTEKSGWIPSPFGKKEDSGAAAEAAPEAPSQWHGFQRNTVEEEAALEALPSVAAEAPSGEARAMVPPPPPPPPSPSSFSSAPAPIAQDETPQEIADMSVSSPFGATNGMAASAESLHESSQSLNNPVAETIHAAPAEDAYDTMVQETLEGNPFESPALEEPVLSIPEEAAQEEKLEESVASLAQPVEAVVEENAFESPAAFEPIVEQSASEPVAEAPAFVPTPDFSPTPAAVEQVSSFVEDKAPVAEVEEVQAPETEAEISVSPEPEDYLEEKTYEEEPQPSAEEESQEMAETNDAEFMEMSHVSQNSVAAASAGAALGSMQSASPEDFVTAIMRLTQVLEQKLGAETPSSQAFTKGAKVSNGGAVQIDMGPLAPLLADPNVNDILINGPFEVYVEHAGGLQKTDVHFESAAQLKTLAHKIVEGVGRRLDADRPLVDARLQDGSRVNIIAPPLAIDGITMSIRKFGGDSITLDSMQASGSIGTPQLADFLKACASSKVNIVISGGTGSGKTTLLNAISQYIRPTDRIVTIEDSAELQLKQPHVVRLETKVADHYGDTRSEVNIRDLLKNALRMRPDRIVVGEVRGAEAFDMIQAMNTGHDGSLTTIHSNNPRDAMARIENMISMASSGVPMNAIRKQIASAVHLMIQTVRMEDGSRRITHVSEIIGMEGEVVTMQDLFVFKKEGLDEQGNIVGRHLWAGVYPRNEVLNKLVRENNVFGNMGM